VSVDGNVTGSISRGLVVLLGVEIGDGEDAAKQIAEKILNLRVFPDGTELMNRSIRDVAGSVLLVSQFTLLGDARKGRRPSFIRAAREEAAKPLYELVGALIERAGTSVSYGIFGAHMNVVLVNDGPVTILLDTNKVF
jgi:D-tyrosyl-tRNA(Tyr) deacylase